MDSKKKIPYKSYLFKMCSVLVLLVSVTFCWFVFSKENTIDSLQVEVTSVVNVTISDDSKEEWDDKIEIDPSDMTTVTEYSGNGEKLYLPIIARNEVQGYFLDTDSLNYDTMETGYIEITTYVKTDGPICFYLGENSSITPKDPNKFEDNIAGAIRVALLVEGYEPFIWVPNTTYEYDADTKTVTKNGTPEEKFYYVETLEDKQILEANELVEIENTTGETGYANDGRFVWGDLDKIENYTSNVSPIFRTSKDLDKELEIKMVIRIWIEGTDREAVKSMIGGKFNLNLTFRVTDNK